MPEGPLCPTQSTAFIFAKNKNKKTHINPKTDNATAEVYRLGYKLVWGWSVLLAALLEWWVASG